MRPFGSAKKLERRRRRAVALLEQGLGLREVARRVQASVSSVHQWREAWRKRGAAGLDPKPTPGRPTNLTTKQREKLLAVLREGAVASGFPTELWTLKRMAAVIRREFGVRYHPSHVWKILRACGWSCQVPERRARQRDEAAIAHWKRYQWPAIKKSPKTWGPSRLPR